MPLGRRDGSIRPTDPSPATPVAVALDAAARGWYVLPLLPGEKRPASHPADRCPCTGPCRDGHRTWEQRATLDGATITAYWSAHPTHGVGIATGPSGLVVVDLDTPKPGDRPPSAVWAAEGVRTGVHALTVLARRVGESVTPTYAVRTGRGGWHLYYQAPAGVRLTNTGRSIGPWIDTRAWGGQVVAAGNTVSGRPYTLTHDAPPAPLPPWLFQLIQTAPLPPQRPVRVAVGAGRRSAYITAAVNRQLAYITHATGGRNNAVYRSAVALGQLVAGGALTEADATDMLKQAAGGHVATDPTFTWAEVEATISSGLRAGARRPRAVPA
ncbi:bifunctional DNA primase/polymerase [Parafrankia sp. EUN1f]|uniref:bifunctional DNA primase/polymerase n=1 Tax=Parafrankia sp. EUN1f TaxID=102897 RepID=UPI001E5D2728|nr:bifunctional DNA primase/polymerase [Parafrankia sp. EUN1f]